jgi:ATP-dependent Clp protease ATP-binding subunit ClpA
MLIKLNEDTKKVIAAARESAIRQQYAEIGSEHILLGALSRPGAMAAEALEEQGIKPDKLCAEIQSNLPSGPGGQAKGEAPFDRNAKEILAAAAKEAEFFQVEEIGPEHILLGILGSDKNPAYALFKAASGGINERIRKALKESLGRIRKRRLMMDKFNEQASAVILNARNDADKRKNEHIEPSHILSAILGFPGSVAMAGLTRQKADLKVLAAMLGRFLSEIPKRKDKDGGLSFSGETKKALDKTVEACEAMKSAYIGPEHFLLGIMGMEGSNAALALKEAGIKSLKSLREEIDMVIASKR